MECRDTTIESITPEIAATYLQMNKNPRRLRKHIVTRYANVMKRGQWESAHPMPIIFTDSGHLVNGQHRLSAIVESGTTQMVRVLRNQSQSIAMKIDDGLCRSSADGLPEDTKNKTIVAAVCKQVILYENGMFPNHRPENVPTVVDVREFYDDRKDSVDEAVCVGTRCGASGLRTPTIFGVVFFLVRSRCPEKARAFFDSLISGIGLETNSPILQLRNRIMRQSNVSKIETNMEYALCFKAWNSFWSNKPCQQLKWAEYESFPKLLP